MSCGGDNGAAAPTGDEIDEDDKVAGNVNKFVAYPAAAATGSAVNAAGSSPDPGTLIFDASFECGNLGRVDCISEYEYDLFIRPDTCNNRFRVWFNFTVANTANEQRVIFNVVNFSKTKSLFREGMSPVVKSTSRPKWARIPAKYVYWYRCPDHRRNYVLTFAFCFDKPNDIFQFAYCYPYSYTRLQNYLSNITGRRLPFLSRRLLTLSLQQRRVDLLTITDAKETPGRQRKLVFVTSRVHPGESPSSYVVQGLIDFLISNHPAAVALRSKVVFMIVPMLNPDGVYLGNYRCSFMGFDLNRQWLEPVRWSHPTIADTKQLLLDLSNEYDMEFYIDIHAHSTALGCFFYGNSFEDALRQESQSILPKLLSQVAEDFNTAAMSFNKDAIKAGTGRRTLGGILDENSFCYTLETSFFGFNGSDGLTPYTEASLFKLGCNLGRAFTDYYRVTGLIPLLPPSACNGSA